MRNNRPTPEPGVLKSALRVAGAALFSLMIPIVTEVVPAEAATSPMLPVKSTVLVSDGRVDASMLVGNDIEPSLREALAKIPVGFISEPLGTIILRRSELAQKLGSLAGMVVLPQRVQVLRKGAMLAGDEIGTKVRELCLESLASDSVGDIQIDLSRIPHHVVLPNTLNEWKLTPMSSNKLGMRIFQLEARCGEDTVRQIIQADVCRMIRAARLRRLVKRGECITDADLIEEKIRLRNDQANPPVAITAAAGKQLANFKSPGTMLRESDLATTCIPKPGKAFDSRALSSAAAGAAAEPHSESPALPGETGPEPVFAADSPVRTQVPMKNTALTQLRETTVHQVLRADNAPGNPQKAPLSATGNYLIKSGDKVEFTVKSGNLSLVVPARALQSGRAGEAIKLLNLQNNRQIKGFITMEGNVEHVAN